MTRKYLRNVVVLITLFYAFAIVVGICMYYSDNHQLSTSSTKSSNYELYKDLMPLIIAIPAAYLGFCFQRRSSYLESLRRLWSHLIDSINLAIQYTHLESPDTKAYAEALTHLSKSIDEMRGVYKNLDESENTAGLFPFEDLKCIHFILSDLHPKTFTTNDTRFARGALVNKWIAIRKSFLRELERSEPVVYDTPFKSRKS